MKQFPEQPIKKNNKTGNYKLSPRLEGYVKEIFRKEKVREKSSSNKEVTMNVEKALLSISHGDTQTKGQLLAILGKAGNKQLTSEDRELTERDIIFLTENIQGFEEYYGQAAYRGTTQHIVGKLIQALYYCKANIVPEIEKKSAEKELLNERYKQSKQFINILEKQKVISYNNRKEIELHITQDEAGGGLESYMKKIFHLNNITQIKAFIASYLDIQTDNEQVVLPWKRIIFSLIWKTQDTKKELDAMKHPRQHEKGIVHKEIEYTKGTYKSGRYRPSKHTMGYVNELYNIIHLKNTPPNHILQHIFGRKLQSKGKFQQIIGKLGDSKRDNFLEYDEIYLVQGSKEIISLLEAYKLQAEKKNRGSSYHAVCILLEMFYDIRDNIALPVKVVGVKKSIKYKQKSQETLLGLKQSKFIIGETLAQIIYQKQNKKKILQILKKNFSVQSDQDLYDLFDLQPNKSGQYEDIIHSILSVLWKRSDNERAFLQERKKS